MDSLTRIVLRDSRWQSRRHSAYFDASEGTRLRQEFARRVLCKRQRGFLRCKVLRINPRPVRARTDATRGRGNELGRTIGCTAHNTAGHFGRKVHPTAKFPDKVVIWVLRLLRSSHPPRKRKRRREEAQRAGSTTPTLFTPLQAIYTRPSAVATMWRTVPPPEGITARANCSVFGLN